MLETDEVDDDFFTPVAGTSLANIFGNVTKKNEGKSNDSLKYVPPKPQSVLPKQEQIKTTECIFACALIGHEWYNNVYTSRGKLGFAIVKIQKTGAHNIVLYDSNKTTLSCTTLSANLEVTIKNDTYISYYDNLRKYWSIYGTKEEVKKVAEHLTSFEVNIQYSSYTDQGPPEPNFEIKAEVTSEQSEKIDKGSDTDSSINRKTKASILNRMANMGHSVLPTRAVPVERTSDSSDTMETDAHPKSVRHKPVKSIIKRNHLENMSESQQITESHQRTIVPKTESIGHIPLYASHSGQLLPMTSTNLITGPCNEMGMFISEQRISNSELRININRITDKVDTVLEKINNFEPKRNTNVQTDILMKLLTEYENKIKVYEEILKSRTDKNIEHISASIHANNDHQVVILQNKITEFENINQDRNKEVLKLQEEIKLLKSKYDQDKVEHVNNESELLTTIDHLEISNKEKYEELADIRKLYENLVTNTTASNDNIGDKLAMVNLTLETVNESTERESLLALQSDLQQLIQLTRENLEALVTKDTQPVEPQSTEPKDELDDEYALFMQEMAKSGAYEETKGGKSENSEEAANADSDIEDELSSLLGMKCAVYHTHKWGGQPGLYNAMVSSIVPKQDEDQFQDLQVRVLFTHPTHAEMLPCPFFLDGECKFSDEQCRYSHGALVQLSNLKEAIEPDFSSIKVGSRILMKLKPPDNEEIGLAKKSTEKYHLWHRAVIRSIDIEKRTCSVKLEHGVHSGEKRKHGTDEYRVKIEEIFPLNTENEESDDSDDSLSDTEYPQSKAMCEETVVDNHALIVERSLLNKNITPIGHWEQHTRGIGSKIMFAMGYVAGTGLGAASDGRVQPVEARVLPVGKSLDQCMAISEKHAAQDPLKVEQKLKRLQKKEEERNKRAYEREKERERRNVFNFLNKTLGDKTEADNEQEASLDVKQSTSKDLNIEQFKITEDKKRIEKDIIKLNSSLIRHASGSNGHKNINMQIAEKNKELNILVQKEMQISKEQTHRKDKQKMTVF